MRAQTGSAGFGSKLGAERAESIALLAESKGLLVRVRTPVDALRPDRVGEYTWQQYVSDPVRDGEKGWRTG
jgi:hypothetical protein